MPYALKYINEFNNESDDGVAQKTYTLQFLFKDYSGPEIRVEGGETSVIQRCTLDDPFAPIKGQSLDITLVNENSSLPITAFQSDDDDGVMVKLMEGANVLFIGFLVQDDFYESLVDSTHTITLSANDSLGLLKGVILSEAEVRRAFQASFRTNGVNTVVYMYVTDTGFYPQAGNIIEILGNTYTIATAVNETTVIGIASYNWTVTLTATTGGIAQTVDTIYLTGEVDLLQRNSILSMIAVCLAQTNLTLITNIFHNLYEYRQSPLSSTFAQTLIDSQTFIRGDTYDDCYTALSKLMTAFKCSLFQANGQWNIVHWFEAVPKLNWSFPNNAIPGFVYDETWTAAGSTVFNNNFFIGPTQPTTWLAGLQAGAMRGWKFSRKVFDYQQPKYLLRNWDLQELGALIRQYNTGTETNYEYVAPGWTGAIGPIVSERFIRIVKTTATGFEVDRYLVIRGNSSNTILDTSSNNIEAQALDKIIVSFSTRTNFSQGPSYGAVFGVRLINGTLTRYVDELPTGNGDWIPTVGFSQTITPNTNQWTNVEIPSSQIPFDGLVNVFLAQNNGGALNNSRETHYKDIRFEYIPHINDGTKIIGQIHKQERPTGPKLFEDLEITVDDSPRNNIVGTLFNPKFTGLLQDRTRLWVYPATGNALRLGESATFDELTQRMQTRTKLEGGFTGNYQNSVVSLLTMCIMDFDTTKNYTFGLLTIDYKRGRFTGSLWELYKAGQAQLTADYTFVYKYSTE